MGLLHCQEPLICDFVFSLIHFTTSHSLVRDKKSVFYCFTLFAPSFSLDQPAQAVYSRVFFCELIKMSESADAPYSNFGTNQQKEDRLTLFGKNWRKRMLALIGFCAVGLVCFIIALSLLVAGVGKKDTLISSSVSHLIKPTECLDSTCLEASASLIILRNQSVDPCTNFHAYACSSQIWSQNRLKDDDLELTMFHRLYEENEERVRNVLGGKSGRTVQWAADVKIKKFYQSCLNTYGNTVNGPKDFITKLINPAGGWNALGTMDEATYDLTSALKKVHNDFWTDALFSITVGSDWVFYERSIIQVRL